MMKCNTIRMNKDCPFMTKKGCSYRMGACLPIVEKCGECKNVEVFNDKTYCTVYMNPEVIWTTSCGKSTVKQKPIIEDAVKKVNPLKQSKKDSGGKMKKKK